LTAASFDPWCETVLTAMGETAVSERLDDVNV